MAAYAALVSLLNVMDHIQNHPRLLLCLANKQVQSLCEKIDFLLEFVETDSVGVKNEETEILEREIACAAYAAEDVIESHVVNQIRSWHVPVLDLRSIIGDIDSVKEKVVNVKDQRKSQLDVHHPTYRSSSVSSSATPHHRLTNKSNKMVGFDAELTRLLDELTGHQYGLQIIPIVGMGGIGKTTLARTVFENPLILQKFDIRSWVTISQQFSVRDIFLKLLSCKSGEADEHELGERVYRNLIGKRYLIILDDIWSLEAWHMIKIFFPDNKNASRILVTTRLLDMAAHFGTSLLALKFLDEAESWELFCEKAFPQVPSCPRELKKIGKEITRKCKGLPLSIAVIGALLSKSSSMQYWENISQNMNSVLDSGDESLDILSLSYGHLPAYLKPCFLYMGVFPEDHEIHVSRLIKLWVSEGFIKPNKTQSLEEIAEGYLQDLIDRNLVLVRRWSRLDGKMETCHMHDLLRDLCLKTGQREKFMCVMRPGHDVGQGVDKERRFVFHEKSPYESKHVLIGCQGLESASLTRSLISLDSLPIKYQLLRVLHTDDGVYQWADIRKQVNLRYVCITKVTVDQYFCCKMLSSISLLWNLQTLIISYWHPIDAPAEIWEMLQLRHVDVHDLYLPDPPPRMGDQQDNDQLVLQKLKKVTVSGLNHHELLKRIPNVMELEIKYQDAPEQFAHGFDCLHKLKSLKLWCFLPRKLTFPCSLRKLTLGFSNLEWGQMTVIGALPNLEVLRLLFGSVGGFEWSPVEGQFLRLKFLEINGCDLINWYAEASHFPVLEKLVLQTMLKLDEIPSGIGEINTLRLIDLIDCSDSAAISAMGILSEQESLGYEELQLRITFLDKDDIMRFRKKVVEQEFEGFTSTSLQICNSRDWVAM